MPQRKCFYLWWCNPSFQTPTSKQRLPFCVIRTCKGRGECGDLHEWDELMWNFPETPVPGIGRVWVETSWLEARDSSTTGSITRAGMQFLRQIDNRLLPACVGPQEGSAESYSNDGGEGGAVLCWVTGRLCREVLWSKHRAAYAWEGTTSTNKNRPYRHDNRQQEGGAWPPAPGTKSPRPAWRSHGLQSPRGIIQSQLITDLQGSQTSSRPGICTLGWKKKSLLC